MGAAQSEITIQKFDDVENVIVSKSGQSDEKIVIGAHYDKTPDGCGAIDNWSGIVALAHLYRSLKNMSLNKNIVFVGFGKEEKGLLGSKAFVKSISKERISQYCVMVNIDSLGLGAPQVAHNSSSKKLEERAASLAREMKMPFGNAPIEGADADSTTFLAKKMPALTIHGLVSNWPSILHSSNDQTSKVLPQSVYLGYRLALALVVDIDKGPCNLYR